MYLLNNKLHIHIKKKKKKNFACPRVFYDEIRRASILMSCWCITGHPVERLYHDVEKVETIGYRCLAHVLLTVP